MDEMIELHLMPMSREAEEEEVWPQWEVKVKHGKDGPTFAVEVAARDQEHARAMLEHVSESIAVIAVAPLADCQGCEVCRTFGGCGIGGRSAPPIRARELARGANVQRWISGLCERLGARLLATHDSADARQLVDTVTMVSTFEAPAAAGR